MSQLQKVTGVATSIRTEGRTTHVRYHQTDVVSFTSKHIVLRSGGWQTATTKVRMNQTANQFNLGFRVYADRGKWFVRYIDGSRVLPFVDGMRLDRRPMRWTGEQWQAIAHTVTV